jgi:predicted nuclease with TOPRIM domain
MKNKAINIGLIIIICAVGWLYYQNDKERRGSQYSFEKESFFQEAKEKNEKMQAYYDTEITRLSDSISVLNGMIESNETQLQYLKSKRNEKTNNISKFSTVDISKFVSDFYKDSIK